MRLSKIIPKEVNTEQFLKAPRIVMFRWIGGDPTVPRTPPRHPGNRCIETTWATAERRGCYDDTLPGGALIAEGQRSGSRAGLPYFEQERV